MFRRIIAATAVLIGAMSVAVNPVTAAPRATTLDILPSSDLHFGGHVDVAWTADLRGQEQAQFTYWCTTGVSAYALGLTYPRGQESGELFGLRIEEGGSDQVTCSVSLSVVRDATIVSTQTVPFLVSP